MLYGRKKSTIWHTQNMCVYHMIELRENSVHGDSDASWWDNISIDFFL